MKDTVKKNKPKDIMDLVKSYEDACKYKKVKPIHTYDNKKTTDTVDEIAYKRLKFTIAVLNEGHVFTMSRNEKRYIPYFNLPDENNASSSFRFSDSDCGDWVTVTSGGSHLCSKSEELAKHVGNYLIDDWKKFLLP